uniref:Uncharacterized protein n=1 Tax=Theileria lestoquardi TaxID=77054 RepID=A0A165EXT3_THELE|nr:hypothetical protein [Theileria lestoquardi]
MQKDLEDKHKDDLKKRFDDLDKQQKEQLESFQRHFKPYTEIPNVDFILDVNVPVTTPTKYQTGPHTVSLSKTTFTKDPDLVDYTHTLEGYTFVVSSLKFCGKTYKVPKIKTNIITSYAFKNDPGFCYFLMAPGTESRPLFFKNNGDEFELCSKFPNIKGEMLELAKKFGRTAPSGLPKPETPISPGVAPQPSMTPHPTSPFAFNLTVNDSFIVGSVQVKLTLSSEFQSNYKAYKYSVTGGKITPTSFTIGNNTQSGLPVNESFDSVTVYFFNQPLSKDTTPLLVSFDQTKNFLNLGNNNWRQSRTTLVEQELNLVYSKLNSVVCLNLSRRSDYYRNGTGSSNVEETKDMNVYVEVDKPTLSWSTYTHKLEDGGQGGSPKSFYIGKLLFGDRKFNVNPEGEIQSVEVYGKNFRTTRHSSTIFGVIILMVPKNIMYLPTRSTWLIKVLIRQIYIKN